MTQHNSENTVLLCLLVFPMIHHLEGFDEALNLKKREVPPRQPILDGEKEARLIALACGKPPHGRAKWTLKLLAQELVALEIVEAISDQTVRRKLKKMNLSHICGKAG